MYLKVLIWRDDQGFRVRELRDEFCGAVHKDGNGRVFRWVQVIPRPGVEGDYCLVGVEGGLLGLSEEGAP